VMSKIPREEVEDIARTVWEELDGLEKGYEYTICGGEPSSCFSSLYTPSGSAALRLIR
jgi:hypothetical protein